MDFEAAGDALLSSSEEGAGRPGSAGDARILAFRSKVREKKERGGGGRRRAHAPGASRGDVCAAP